MRWLFLLVVLINAGFFSWHSFSQDQRQAFQEKVYAPPVGTKIALMSEPVEELSVKPAQREIAERREALERLEGRLQNAVSEAESNLRNPTLSSDGVGIAATQEPRDEDVKSCRIIETEREKDHKAILVSLNKKRWAYTETQKIGERDKYWLYISAPNNRAAANKIVADLKGRGVDSFIINRGEMKNRISLGLYSSKVRAEQAAAAIKTKANYDVEVFEHQRKVSLYVVDIATQMTDELFNNWLKSLEMEPSLIKIEKKSC
ncbi:SPOR domain-containing protein [Marinomonas mediterranea]|jgi:Sporulation related domain.|uniref:Sporulation domain-containing protein n=1 Tax=Marinomonas mediterranea (strain ATCC 700492 / JCM 21426 / NBRC 103028 / MMB-1) TaxID=717774 RepID=F2JX09_MARM1|nr:SPOR domain-containing protein [Marinomonas mediterranea]ADZ89528.1 Sporulation domain-containing protein [Marinomonas mediterranea MMB-1]WCN11723.1 SPOR domain-containing protein [Marinomonas mediterranea]WCN15771.1 SPOR domain-containing protein [Marinomonas mediterranea MMB-1]